MFTCTICFSEYLNDSCSNNYVCGADSCDTVICLNCEDIMYEMYELIPIDYWFNYSFFWMCSYKCILNYIYLDSTLNIDTHLLYSIPYFHHIEAEKEIFDRHLYTKLVDEIYFLKELAQVVIEFLN